jgi:hypothetical protein
VLELAQGPLVVPAQSLWGPLVVLVLVQNREVVRRLYRRLDQRLDQRPERRLERDQDPKDSQEN